MATAREPIRIGYADPPYIGQARKHYAADPRCAEVDHAELVARLVGEFPDGWALSCSTPTLREILALCPGAVRVGAWVKPFASFKPGVNPAYAWEPVVFLPGRHKRDRSEDTVRDWVSASITLKKGLSGAKPEEFSFWLFALMGMQPGDELVDLYPGTGGVTAAWEAYQRQARLPRLQRVINQQREILVDLGASPEVLAAADSAAEHLTRSRR